MPDINIFRLIGNDSGDYAADKNTVYYQDKIVEGANPYTFVNDPKMRCGKDGKNRYFYGELQ